MSSEKRAPKGWLGYIGDDQTTQLYPIGSMYGIFSYIYSQNQPNVGIYTIHGSYGYGEYK